MSPMLPTRRPRWSAPCAWAVSSITRRSCSCASAMIGSRSTVEPIRCTGITARVLGPIAAATCSAVSRCVVGSTSTSFGVAPTQLTASAVAMNEFAGTITSSPGPISSARSASEIASVPEETPTERLAPQ